MTGFRQRVPWWAKIGIKLVLARLPVSYRGWERLSLFKHGRMEVPDYAFEIFRRHYARVELPRKPFVALELGPGDSLLSVLIARAFGACRTYAVDVEPFARTDVELFRAMSSYLRDRGFDSPDTSACRSIEEVLVACDGAYATEGLHSLRDLPNASVDFVWSQAVLEHVPRREFLEIQKELRRIVRPHGVCSHRIDLSDHLQDGLNNLRFPSWLWESGVVERSGFYTNRLRLDEMLVLFEQAGFAAEVLDIDRWASPPIPRRALAREFRGLSDEALRVSGFDVVLRPLLRSG